jgi:hypothetical protein
MNHCFTLHILIQVYLLFVKLDIFKLKQSALIAFEKKRSE